MARVGLALLALGLAPRIRLSRELRRQGQPARVPWRRVYVSPTALFGLILLVGAVSPTTGEVALAVLMVWAIVVIVELRVRGVRGVWRLPIALCLMGDPDAWRGIHRPYWDRRSENERTR